MAIVTCKSCGRWLYRPDEMSGTAWQCIGCGPTEIEPNNMSLPVRLAQLLQEEYKRVVWERIYPSSNSMSRDFPLITDPSAKEERPQPDEQAIASAPCSAPLPEAHAFEQKRLEIPEGSRTWWIAWIFAISAVIVLLPQALVHLIAKSSRIHHEGVLVITIFGASFAVIAVFCFLLALRPIRRMRLWRILKSQSSPRSPNARIDASTANDAFRNGERESRTNGSEDLGEDVGQFRK
jgi:hypothetical protein